MRVALALVRTRARRRTPTELSHVGRNRKTEPLRTTSYGNEGLFFFHLPSASKPLRIVGQRKNQTIYGSSARAASREELQKSGQFMVSTTLENRGQGGDGAVG